jgi:predicted DNA-binding transcriptional regulator AlpA
LIKAELTLPSELVDQIADRVIEKLLPLLDKHDYQNAEDKIFTVKHLSEYIGLSQSYIYNNKHKIPHFDKREQGSKRKGKPLFRKSDIDQWLEYCKKNPENRKIQSSFRQQH